MRQGLFLRHIGLQDADGPAGFALLDVQGSPLGIDIAPVLGKPRRGFGLGLLE